MIRSRSPRWLTAVVALAAGGLLLAACGGDDGDRAGGCSGGELSTSPNTEGSEFAYDPCGWTVPAGEEATITMENTGVVPHNWIVLDEEISSESDFDEGSVIASLVDVAGGDTGSASFTIDEAGTYQVVCTVPGHFAAGMEGTLTVE